MRAHDWAATPLGSPEHWPEGLKVPLRMLLTSRFEMWLGWGENLAFFYNDAYVPTLGVKHPTALGRPMREVWKEVFSAVEDRIVSVMRDGVATWDKALMLLLERSGYLEETYHTFSYSPLRGDTGAIEGLMCVVTEETERVISERRLETLRVLAEQLLSARDLAGVLQAAAKALASNRRDFPFGFVEPFGPAMASASAMAAAPWPYAEIAQGGECRRVPLRGLLADPPRGDWDIAPTEALMAPVTQSGRSKPSATLVLGLNPYRPNDPDILGFAQLIASQIAGALAVVDSRAGEAAEVNRLRQMFEQAPSFMVLLRGPNHRVEMLNPGYTQLVSHRDVIGRDLRDALPEVAEQGFITLLDAVYETGEPYEGQGVRAELQRTPGGASESHILDFIYQPIRGADGAVNGIFVQGVDVTSAHASLAALRKSEAQFRTLAEAMPNHVWAARPDGYIDWFNSGVYGYSGAAPGELDGAAWGSFVHPDDLPGTGVRWAASVSSGETYEAEFRLRRADGVYRWHIARAVPQRDESGAIVRWIGTNTDIEDQKATTQALAELNATLEQQVQDRTGALMATEEALRQSQKMEAVGQLTGGIAHDFNNLLTGITGSLDLLETRIRQGRLESIPRYVAAAQGAAKRAAALTQRLLAFSRRQTLDPKAVNVNRLIADLEELLRRTAGPAIEMEVVGAGGLWTTLIDPNQLENAILNLCINARDAMPDGGKLTIETANKWLDERAAREIELTPGQYVSLCVTDTGTGMTPEVIARAFDPFFTTKPLGSGTGLGLSMIYGFVRQSGGQVRIYSEIGAGTTLCLYLPRHHGEAEDAAPAAKVAATDFGAHGETVLVIDDEPTVRMLITDVLAEAGYAALEAVDGPAGLRIMQSDARIDLLITDVGLPGGMNGRQVADAGRAIRPDLKVLFITGYAENAAIGHGHLAPGMQVMTKPFAITALGDRIRQMIDS